MRPTVPYAALASIALSEREAAWDAFVAAHSSLLLRITRAIAHDHDAAMDAYAFILGQLRDDGFRRLSTYRVADNCTFEGWLAVVARRLCLDHCRRKYGRARSTAAEVREAHEERRRLVDLVSAEFEQEIATSDPRPDAGLEREEIIRALDAALSQLSPKDKLLLRYRFDDGLSARKIASVMRFPTIFHVYRRINAILKRCRNGLGEEGFRFSDV